MPIYTFRCPTCGHVEDRIVAMHGDAATSQVCGYVAPPVPDHAGGTAPPAGEQASATPCTSTLVRDGIETPALMRHQWMP